MPVQSAPCSWDPDYSTCDLPPGWIALDETERAKFEEMSATLLWQWTGQSFGACPEEIHPVLESCPVGWTTYGGGYRHPRHRVDVVGGQPIVAPCGCHKCSQLPTRALVVLPGPIIDVQAVQIDGEDFPLSSTEVVESRTLIRTDGEPWPTADDCTDWSVTYRRGVEVPVGGRIAAGILAVELWKASCQDKTCALPQRVQSITRQGVSMAVLDDFSDIAQGRTGIWLVDSWVASITRPPSPTRVFNPNDLDQGSRARRGKRYVR